MTVKRKFKTKRKVGGSLQRNFHPWTREDGKVQVWFEGDFIIGRFVTSITDKWKNQNPIFEILDYSLTSPVLDKEGKEVEIMGKNLQLNHNGSLAYALYGENDKGKDPVDEGEIVQITYAGMSKLESGPFEGKMSHQIEVEVLEEELEEVNDDDCY